MTRKYTTLPYIEDPVATGNFDGNRLPITGIILHTTVGTLAAAKARFNNPTSHVSAHYIVDTDGTLHALLEEFYVAYQAGNYPVNQRTIGIEHVDNGDYNGVRPDSLYTESAKLVADICKFYDIPCDRTRIQKHSEVHATGCPDALDVDRIVREANALLNPVTPPNMGTDQTKYDFGDGFGVMELQAAKSKLHEQLNTINDKTNKLTQIHQLSQ